MRCTPPHNSSVISPPNNDIDTAHNNTQPLPIGFPVTNECPTPIRQPNVENFNVLSNPLPVNEVPAPVTNATVNELPTIRTSTATTKRLKQSNQCKPLDITNAFMRGKHDHDKLLNPKDNGSWNKSEAMNEFRNGIVAIGTIERQPA